MILQFSIGVESLVTRLLFAKLEKCVSDIVNLSLEHQYGKP